MKEVINAAQAARIIGCEPAAVRFYMQKGIWNFGQVISKKQSGKKLRKYIVNVRDLCAHFSIPLEEAERRLSKK